MSGHRMERIDLEYDLLPEGQDDRCRRETWTGFGVDKLQPSPYAHPWRIEDDLCRAKSVALGKGLGDSAPRHPGDWPRERLAWSGLGKDVPL